MTPPAKSSLDVGQETKLTSSSAERPALHRKQQDAIGSILIDLVSQKTGYPRESITLEMRLLDDLNLDSIKAAELIAGAAREAGMAGKLDASKLATAKLEEVAAALRALQSNDSIENTLDQKQSISPVIFSSDPEPSNRIRYPSWVRDFAIELREQPLLLSTRDREKARRWWAARDCWIICEREEHQIAQVMASYLEDLGAHCRTISYGEIAPTNALGEKTDFIALPPTKPGQGDLPERLPKVIQRLAKSGLISPVQADVGLTFIQFAGGGAGKEPADIEVASVSAFARSLHLEQPDLRIRVIDLAGGITPKQMTEVIMDEIPGEGRFKAVSYDSSRIRRVPQALLQDPSQYRIRESTWSKADVVLVTGGAKGITAECALALSKRTGVQLALVGVSSLQTASLESELRRNLVRLQKEGIRFRYYACDIVDPEAVNTLVEQVQREMGRITCVIHGAGLNKPRRIEQVSPEEALEEVSPKILGAYHLWHALQSNPPRFFIAFTSIIGITGMPGNAWYAFSNEALDLFLKQIRSASPTTQTLALAYSVWGETGMGARMGSVKQLGQWGIDAIPTEEGIKHFLQLFERDPGHQQVVITARLGGLDTWPAAYPVPDDLRFIDRIELFQPQIELLVRTHLTLERDRYVKDHVFRGSHLFPTVFGLEAMAQAVTTVTGEPARSICRIENIGLDRPIVVDPEHGLEIEIYALAEEGTRSGERAVRVGIRTEQTGFASDHFSATFVLGTRQEGEIVPLALESLKRPALKLDLSTQLYGSILFQGPLFQRIGPVYELDEHHVVFESSVIEPPVPYPEVFGEDAVGRIILGDPFLRDTLLQSLQLVVPQEVCLPIRIERLELYNTADTRSSKRIVVLPSKVRWGQEYQTEVLVTDEQGRILECMEGYWLRIMEEHPEYPTPAELANANPEDTGSREIYRLDPNTHIARVSHDGPQGQPVFEFSQLVSFHNSSALSRHVPLSKYAWWMGKMRETVLAAGVPHIAGKIATGKWGMVTNWTELRVLGEITANDVVLMRFWGTRPKGSEFHYCCDFWKISGEKRERVAFSEQKATWVRLTGHGQVSVEPLPRDLKRFLEDLGQKTEGHGGLPEIDEPWSHLDLGSTLFEATSMPGASRPLYTYTVQTTLEDANQVGNVYFANYIAWQDRVRELFLFSVIPDYLRGTGENGEMVTLRNRVDHLREAMPFDTIAVVLYLRSVRTCGATFDFEYFRVAPDGGRLKLAVGYQEVAWMKRQNGQAVAAPLPDELRRSLFTERAQAVA